MKNWFNYYDCLALLAIVLLGNIKADISITTKSYIISNHTVNIVKTAHTILLGCEVEKDNQRAVMMMVKHLMEWNNLVQYFNIRNENFTLTFLYTNNVYATTTILLDCSCEASKSIILEASRERFFNTSYQWLLWDTLNTNNDNSSNNIDNKCSIHLLQPDIKYLGPNAQITLVTYDKPNYTLWDIHSKGRHLEAPLEYNRMAIVTVRNVNGSISLDFQMKMDIQQLRTIHTRGQFSGLTLRGAAVIDQDNILYNEQIEKILSRSSKDVGVAPFSKYHYELLNIVRDRLNFTVNFRNSRGWAGHLGNTSFRLGYLGVMQRNEADIGASAMFPRLSRVYQFDTLHQGWKFLTAFVFLYTPELSSQNKQGNFMAPFEGNVWYGLTIILIIIIIIWSFEEYVTRRCFSKTTENLNQLECFHGNCWIPLNVLAAMCQQGLDPMPKGVSTRVIILTLFVFSLVMYNYYTSSVVGGLLSNNDMGPSTPEDIVSSSLKLSFEDIGYYKVKFRETKTPLIITLLNKKILPQRNSKDLPVYTNLENALPYLKKGGYAFHCELVDAYPEIAKQFDMTEICNLRTVSGLLGSQLLHWVVHKNSQYTELFRYVAIQAREVGLVKRLLHQRQPKKPPCQGLYTVYPVTITGTLSAFILLGASIVLSLVILLMEIIVKKYIPQSI